MRDSWELPVSVRLAIANWPQDSGHGAVAEFCRTHGISRSWFYVLRKRAQGDGLVGVAGRRSRRPVTSPTRIDASVEELALQVRQELITEGWDGGPISVRHRMLERGLPAPSRSSLARIFARRGVVTANPKKRPKATRRFVYPAPNECWQLDGFDHPLADGRLVSVLQVIDDHSRRIVASRAARGETTVDIQAVLQAAMNKVGVPQRFLSDNAAAFNQSRRGRTGAIEAWLRSLGVQPISSTPGHPQTQGKSERHHQTSQRWLAARGPARDLPELQVLLETLEQAYNERPHQSLGMLTPLQAWASTPVAPPPLRPALNAEPGRPTDGEVIARKINKKGVIHLGMARIQLGRHNAGAIVLTTTEGDLVHIWDKDGLHLRTITLEAGRRYYGNDVTPGPAADLT